jgi:formate dehydrogenase
VLFATAESVAQAVQAHAKSHPDAPDHAQFDPAALAEKPVSPASGIESAPAYVGLDAYRAQGGYALAAAVAA